MFENHHSADPNLEQVLVRPCTGTGLQERAAQTIWWNPFSLGLVELQGQRLITELWDLQL